MKNTGYIIVVIGLLGCGQRGANSEVTNQRDSSSTEKIIVRYNIEDLIPPINLPEGFRLDTIQKIDSTKNVSIFIFLPVSGIDQIDKVVFDDIQKQKDDFIESLDEMIKEDERILGTVNSDFQAEPISVFKDDKVTSYLFIVSYYQAGAAHPMTMYYSLNFDNKTLKRISFSDYFLVESKNDTTQLTDLITRSIGEDGIFVTTLSDIDFNIEQDTISFNFDDYEIASYAAGIIQGRVHRNQLDNKIRTMYR